MKLAELRTEAEVHKRDMRRDPAYRRAIRLTRPGNWAAIILIRLKGGVLRWTGGGGGRGRRSAPKRQPRGGSTRERMRAEGGACWCGCDYPCCANGCVGPFRWRLWQIGNHARRLAGRPYWKREEAEPEGRDDGTRTA